MNFNVNHGARTVALLWIVVALIATACTKQQENESRKAEAAPTSSRMLGMFEYMADAGSFTRCGTHTRIPVAHEGDNAALERAYTTAAKAPPELVLVILEGHVAERPAVEGDGTRVCLIVDRFLNVWPGETCEKAGVETPLTNTYWKLVSLNGDAVETHPGQREVHLLLETDESKVRGFAGCNNFFGGYTVEGEDLRFEQVASTMMACPHLDEETTFLQALEKVTAYEILGESLELCGDDGMRARFKAVYFE
jgi:copper homeostasis protein (lipoprotein)